MKGKGIIITVVSVIALILAVVIGATIGFFYIDNRWLE